MRKLRLHIFIALGLFLVLFIIGSFLDLQIAQAIFSRDNIFGLVASAVTTIPGYGGIALCGGCLLAFGLDKKYHIAIRICLYVAAVAGFAAGVYFSGREFFSINAFDNNDLKLLGYVIALPIMCGLSYFGYRIAHRSDNNALIVVVIALLVCIFMALIPGVTLLKEIFHRPRYRLISLETAQAAGLYYHSWWVRCPDYKEFIVTLNTVKENFKSFPSGHAGATALLMMYAVALPHFDKKLVKYVIPMFYVGLGYCLFVCFTRMLVGAHFLSDVSMGALFSVIFTYALNEFLIHFKYVNTYLDEAKVSSKVK